MGCGLTRLFLPTAWHVSRPPNRASRQAVTAGGFPDGIEQRGRRGGMPLALRRIMYAVVMSWMVVHAHNGEPPTYIINVHGPPITRLVGPSTTPSRYTCRGLDEFGVQLLAVAVVMVVSGLRRRAGLERGSAVGSRLLHEQRYKTVGHSVSGRP